MLRALLMLFVVLAHAVETRAKNARARGPTLWQCLAFYSFFIFRQLTTSRQSLQTFTRFMVNFAEHCFFMSLRIPYDTPKASMNEGTHFGRGTPVTKSHFSTTSYPSQTFFIRLLIGRELDHLQKSININYTTIWSSFVTIFAD